MMLLEIYLQITPNLSKTKILHIFLKNHLGSAGTSWNLDFLPPTKGLYGEEFSHRKRLPRNNNN